MNRIEDLRAELLACRCAHAFEPGAAEYSASPSGWFRLVAAPFGVATTRQELTRLQVFAQHETNPLAEIWSDDSHSFFGWVATAGREYLLGAEARLGGQTVVELPSGRVAGYAPPEQDGFIWTEFHLSPDGRTLAALGCYWACPFVIKLYDFARPLALPLPELQEIELLDHDEVLLGWLDNHTLHTRGVRRGRDWQPDAAGNYQLVVVSETPVEREIRVGGGG